MHVRFDMMLLLFLYLLANGFIAYRGYRRCMLLSRHSLVPRRWIWSGRLWGILVVYLMISPFLGRSMANIWPNLLPSKLEWGLSWLGYDWMAFCFAWAVLLLAMDLLFYLMQKILVFQSREKMMRYRNIAVLFLLVGYLATGTFCALSTKWITYDIAIHKPIQGYESLRLVCVSDLHLGELIHSNRLEKWVEEINQKQPDMICIMGDIFNRGYQALGEDETRCQELLSKLSAPLGVYACIGNHDTGWLGEESYAQVENWLEEAGIELLVDRFVEVDGLIVAGKDFSWGEREGGAELSFLEGAPKSLPIILLDHKPGYLEDMAQDGVDLTLSGHTHRGQIFPGNIITARLYETHYGYATHNQNQSQIVVSSGVGTWGPVLRIGSRSELVQINLHFEG